MNTSDHQVAFNACALVFLRLTDIHFLGKLSNLSITQLRNQFHRGLIQTSVIIGKGVV